MNIEHLRTFIEVAATGSFQLAASRLHITQSTASTRVKVLEERLEQPLLERHRAGTELTARGRRFLRFAETAVRAWEQGRREVTLPPGYHASFGMGGQASLWDRLLIRWVQWMREHAADVALRLDAGFSDPVIRRLLEGALDLGVVYNARTASGLVTEALMHERLVLVSSEPGLTADGAVARNFLHIDWGGEFAHDLAREYPDMPSPSVSFDLGLIGLQYLLNNAGSGYFPLRTVREHLQARRLHRVRRAPVFRRPVFVAYPESPRDPELLALALRGLRIVARRAHRPD